MTLRYSFEVDLRRYKPIVLYGRVSEFSMHCRVMFLIFFVFALIFCEKKYLIDLGAIRLKRFPTLSCPLNAVHITILSWLACDYLGEQENKIMIYILK